MRRYFLIAAMAIAAAPASAQPAVPKTATVYAADSAWLCLPGRKDVCSTPLATTALNPNG